MNKQMYQKRESIPTSRGLVYILIILLPNVLTGDVFSPIIVSMGIVVLFVSKWKVNKKYFKNVKPLLGIFVIGIIGIIDYETRDVQRDIIYSLMPISLIYMGYWLAENQKTWTVFLKVIIYLGIGFSLIHLTQFVLNPSLLNESLDDIRNTVFNPGGNLIILSLMIGLFQNRMGLKNLFPIIFPRYIALAILFFSCSLSFSRTNFIIAFILYISFLGFIDQFNVKSIIRVGSVIVIFIAIVFTLPDNGVNTFRSKLFKSTSEIAVSDYKDMQDVSSNWRGFESYRAVITFEDGSLFKKLFGHGFGSLVDLGFTMNLNEIDYDKIPILHNGYAYILVKTGLLGIVLYFLFYFNVLKKSIKNISSLNKEKVILSRLLLGLTICLIFSMIVVGGMAEIHDSEFVLLVGYILRRTEQI